MNDGPPAKRSDTQSPFAVLSPEVVRGQTGTRVKITDTEGDSAPPLDEAPNVSPSILPESLKKPFSSLSPKKATPSLAPAPLAGNAPPPPPSQLFAETASIRQPTAPAPSGTTRTPTTRREPNTPSARYGTCKEHGTALTNGGKCVLCVREKAKHDAKNTSRFLLFLAVALVGIAAYVVFRVLPS